jgi:hypothetical protein
VPKRHDILRNSMIIGAHFDDELLWFNSILRDVDSVVIVFRDFWARRGLGAARTAALAEYPRGNVSCLDIDEAGAYGCADWSAPVLTEHGLALGLEAKRRGFNRLVRKSMSVIPVRDSVSVAPESVARSYEANYHAIYAALKTRLTPDMNVFTHNPWGEYGHEEHVQVFRAVQRLREEIGFTLWMSNYCSNRAMPLAMRYAYAGKCDYVRLPTDKLFADKVADVYKKHDCWTWSDDWAWFDDECFTQAPRADSDVEPNRRLLPLNFFTIDEPEQRSWLSYALTVSAASAASAAVALSIAE